MRQIHQDNPSLAEHEIKHARFQFFTACKALDAEIKEKQDVIQKFTNDRRNGKPTVGFITYDDEKNLHSGTQIIK